MVSRTQTDEVALGALLFLISHANHFWKSVSFKFSLGPTISSIDQRCSATPAPPQAFACAGHAASRRAKVAWTAFLAISWRLLEDGMEAPSLCRLFPPVGQGLRPWDFVGLNSLTATGDLRRDPTGVFAKVFVLFRLP